MAQGSASDPPAGLPVSGSSGSATEGRAAIYSVELDLFEGPLDLLLHLVRRHELDILDIPIAFVAEKYLEYLHLMRSLDLEVAGDYLVMAATLAWLKSRELLPQGPREGEQAGADDEEGEDPREALIRRLVEYERFKSAAAELDALPISGRDVFARGADIDIPPMDPGLAPVTLFRLAEAYYRVLTRAKINKTHDVTIELVTVAQRMQQLTLMLDERQEFDFEGLFLGRTWGSEHELRTMLVVTLMSVLELVKLGVARVQQVPDTDAIRVYRLVASDDARKLLETYDEEQSFGAPAPDDALAEASVQREAPQPTEAELDALEERTLLAEALAGLDGTEQPSEPADEIGALAEVLDPAALEADEFTAIADEADLGPEAIAASAANSAGAPDPEPDRVDMSEASADEAADDDELADADSGEPDRADMSEAPADEALDDGDSADADSGEPERVDLSEAPADEAADDDELTNADSAEPDRVDMPEAPADGALNNDEPADADWVEPDRADMSEAPAVEAPDDDDPSVNSGEADPARVDEAPGSTDEAAPDATTHTDPTDEESP